MKLNAYPVLIITALAAALQTFVATATDIDPTISAVILGVIAALESTRRVSPVEPEDRGLRG